MKKTYMHPESRSVELQAESIIAASTSMGLSEEQISGSEEIRTNRNNGPWSGRLWADDTEK